MASRGKRFLFKLKVNLRALRSVFQWRNLKNASKSVTKGFKEYLCFFIAVFAMQVGFVTFALMTDTNIQNAHDTVTEEYGHHVEIVGLDQEQKVNLQYTIDLAITRLDPYIKTATIHKEVDDTYTFMITFVDGVNLSEAKSHILSHDILGTIYKENRDTGIPWSLRTTPLYSYEQDYATTYSASYVALFVLWTVLSVVVLWVLYRVRVNHFRFVYGIYMTCGADFPKLFGTAGGELFMVSLLTMLPAVLTGTGITMLAYLPQGVSISVSVASVIGFVFYDLLMTLLAVYMPMRRMALQTPVQNLVAQDNTSLVSSPRKSFRMFGSGFPLKYELFGIWRLRKYYIGLLLSAVLFASAFVSGLYIADLEKYHADIDPYEYLIHYGSIASLEEEVETDEEGNAVIVNPIDRETAEMIRFDPDIFLEDVMNTSGVSYVDWSVVKRGGSMAAHLLLTPSQLAGGTDSLVPSRERESQGYKFAMNEFSYTAFDEMYVDMLVSQELCTFEGDPYALFEGERQVIISEDSFNQKAYQFSPGDKVLVAVFETAHGAIEMIFKPDIILRQQIENYDFKYVEYTVCAVMRGKTSENNITFGITFDEYEELTGEYPIRNQLKVYMEKGSDFDTVNRAEDEIRSVLQYCNGWQISPSGNYFKTTLNNQKRDNVMIYTLAALLLIISPLVWFFSQIMYYRKRQGEFHMLLALGADKASIPKIHRMTGGVLSGLAFMVTILLSCLLNAVVHLSINTILPKFGLLENVGYDYELSLPALVACILVSVLCGFLSCEVPYRIFKKNKKKDTIEVK